MREYSIELSKTARKQLDKLPNQIAERLIKAVSRLAENPRPDGCKKLKGRLGYRIRVGDHRIIYEVIDRTLTIIVIGVGNRKDIYN